MTARTAPPARGPADAAALTAGGRAAAELAVLVFRLNGQLLDVAERIAAPAGLTAARWQVLSAIVPEPLSVSHTARAMGLTRQAVQRLADILVAEGMAEYRPNPAHKRAKLLALTAQGRSGLDRIPERHRPWANGIGRTIGAERLRQAGDILRELSELVETDRNEDRS